MNWNIVNTFIQLCDPVSLTPVKCGVLQMKTVIRPFLRFVRKISFINSKKVKCIPCNINCHSVLGDILQTSKRLEITETRKKKCENRWPKNEKKVVDSVVEFCLYFKVFE